MGIDEKMFVLVNETAVRAKRCSTAASVAFIATSSHDVLPTKQVQRLSWKGQSTAIVPTQP